MRLAQARIIRAMLVLSLVFWAGSIHAATPPIKKSGVKQTSLKAKKKSKRKSKSSNYILHKDYYVVRKGDSLSKIAVRTHTTVNALVKLNRLKSTTVRPGQRLLIRVRRTAKSLRYATYPDTPPLIEPRPIIVIEGELTFHAVQEGETLESIALQYGLTPEEIREANLMPETAEVKKGQILAIPHEDKPKEDTSSQTGNR
jgi:LysM repeat protein